MSSATPAADRLIFDFRPARRGSLMIPSDPVRYWWNPGWDADKRGHEADADRRVAPDAAFDAAVVLDAREPVFSARFLDAVQPRTQLTLTAWVRWGDPLGASGALPAAPDAPAAAIAMLFARHGAELRVGDGVFRADLDLLQSLLPETSAAGVDAASPSDAEAKGWRFLALRWDGATGEVDLRIDGVRLEVSRPEQDEPAPTSVLPFRRDVEVTLGIGPGAERELRIGPVRLHSRVRTDAELQAERYADLAGHPTVDERSPIAFRVADTLDDPTLYITDDDVAGRTLHIVLENRSRFRVALPDWDDEEDAGRHEDCAPGDCDRWRRYLELRFRPGCLTGGARHWVEPHAPGWRVGSREHPDGGVSLYLARTTPMRLDPGQSAAVTLHHVRASGDLGAHGTHLELLYPHPHHEGVRCSRVSVARVVGQRGRRRSPLRFGVVGAGTVLNDGVRANRLRLYVANSSRTHAVHLQAPVAGVGSTLILAFDAGETGADWALATVDGLLAADVRVLGPDGADAGWNRDVETLGESPEWVLSPTTDMTLQPGDRLGLEVSNLKTDLPAGRTRTYLRLENIPGYWDDDRSVDVVKSRVEADESGLHVDGDLTFAGKLLDDMGELLPAGVVLMWTGAADDIPAGWALCDGTDNTPDLRDKFVLGQGAPAVDRVGGEHWNTLTTSHLPPHAHEIGGAPTDVRVLREVAVEPHSHKLPANFGSLVDTEHHVHHTPETHRLLGPGSQWTSRVGNRLEIDNRPQFFALCFIMKRYGPDDPVRTLPPPPPPEIMTA